MLGDTPYSASWSFYFCFFEHSAGVSLHAYECSSLVCLYHMYAYTDVSRSDFFGSLIAKLRLEVIPLSSLFSFALF
jgi:hypothetical protein